MLSTSVSQIDIIKHTRECEKETRTGRTVTRTITTWDLVEQCSLISEHWTRRDAIATRDEIVAARAKAVRS